MNHAHALLDFWFGPLPLEGLRLEERRALWFDSPLGAEDAAAAVASGERASQREPDREAAKWQAALARRFAPLVERAARGELALWSASPRRRLALILLLDALPRMLHHGTPRAYATDRTALELSLSGMQLGADAALGPLERLFFYLPLRHAESPQVQEESVAVHRRLAAEVEPEPALRPAFVEFLAAAEHDRALIERFGRFPHRNSVLRRLSTRDERAWLRDAADIPRR